MAAEVYSLVLRQYAPRTRRLIIDPVRRSYDRIRYMIKLGKIDRVLRFFGVALLISAILSPSPLFSLQECTPNLDTHVSHSTNDDLVSHAHASPYHQQSQPHNEESASQCAKHNFSCRGECYATTALGFDLVTNESLLSIKLEAPGYISGAHPHMKSLSGLNDPPPPRNV